MNTVENLGEAVGIQWDHTEDRTGSKPATYRPLNNPIIIGRFRRGRTDVSMEITSNNIRSKLGYDPTNPDYIAVQACLDVKGIVKINVINLKQDALEM